MGTTRHRSRTPASSTRRRASAARAQQAKATASLNPFSAFVDLIVSGDVSQATSSRAGSNKSGSGLSGSSVSGHGGLSSAGLHFRLRSTPGWRWVVLLATLAVGCFAGAHLLRRRTPFCAVHLYFYSVCTVVAAVIWFARGLAVLCAFRAVVLTLRRLRLVREVNSLTHLTNNQRRLLGLPQVPNAPATPAWSRWASAAHGTPAGPSTLPSASMATRPTSFTRSPFSPGMGMFHTGTGTPLAHPTTVSPYVSPRPDRSPYHSSSSVVRGRQLGLDANADRYTVGDVLTLEELARLRDRSGADADPTSTLTGVLGGHAGLDGGMGRLGGGGGVGGGGGAGGAGGGLLPVGGRLLGLPSMDGRARRLHTYHAASRADASVGSGAGGDAVGFDRLEETLGVRVELLDRWSTRLRRAVSQHIQDFLNMWDLNLQELSSPERQLSREFLLRQVPTLALPLQEPYTLQEMMLRYRNDPRYVSKLRRDRTGRSINLWNERSKLERFLDVRGEDYKMYVLDRLDLLASDDQLWRFAWDAGGEWAGRPWTPQSGLPTDAHILLHYFVSMMDSMLSDHKARSGASDRAFSTKYRVTADNLTALARQRGSTAIVVVSTQPLHVRVWHDGVQYEVLHGRLNVFYAICLFLFLIKRHHSSHIDHVDVSSLIDDLLDSAVPRT